MFFSFHAGSINHPPHMTNEGNNNEIIFYMIRGPSDFWLFAYDASLMQVGMMCFGTDKRTKTVILRIGLDSDCTKSRPESNFKKIAKNMTTYATEIRHH